MQKRLYVGSEGGAASTLQELFEPHGFVMEFKWVRGDRASQRRGFAFALMATDEPARGGAVRALDGAASLDRLAITVEVAEDGRGSGGAV